MTMKKAIVVAIGCALLGGCAQFKVTQTDTSEDEQGNTVREIKTTTKGFTCLAGKAWLSRLSASTTDKTQSTRIGEAGAEVQGTNTVAIIEAAIGAAVKAGAAVASSGAAK